MKNMKRFFNFVKVIWTRLIHIKSWWVSLVWAFLFGGQVTLGWALIIAAVSTMSVTYGVGAIIAIASAIICYRLSWKRMWSVVEELLDDDEYWNAMMEATKDFIN